MRDSINRILVVVESLDVESSSGAKANNALIRNLRECGYDLYIFHYSGKEVQFSGVEVQLIRENRQSFMFFLSRFEQTLRRNFGWPSHRLWEKIFGFSSKLYSDQTSIANRIKDIDPKSFDLLLTLSHGGSFRPHHAVLKLPQWHSKWLAYIHDPYPMHHFPPPYAWTEPGATKKEAFVREISEKAAFTAFPSQLLLEWMAQFYPQFQKKGVVIPHQITAEEIEVMDFPTWFDPAKFNVVHAGHLLWGRDPKGLIEGFRLFEENCEDVKANANLIFIGAKNHYSEILKQYAEKLSGLTSVQQNISFNVIRKIQNSCSVNIILEAKSYVSPFLPGKFPHCVVAEKPILLLGPDKSESRRLLGEDYPHWAEIDDSKRIASILCGLYREWSRNRPTTLNRPDLRYYLSDKKLKEILSDLLNRNSV